VTHRRRVAFIKPSYWLLIDDLAGVAQHSIDLRFQFAPIDVAVDAELWACAAGRNGTALWVRPFSTRPFEARVVAGEVDPIQGWTAPDYGEKIAAPALVYSTAGALPLRIVTLLFPAQSAATPRPIVSPLFDEQPVVVGLELSDLAQTIRFGADDVVVGRTNG